MFISTLLVRGKQKADIVRKVLRKNPLQKPKSTANVARQAMNVVVVVVYLASQKRPSFFSLLPLLL